MARCRGLWWALMLCLLGAGPAWSGCLDAPLDSRLRLFCLLAEVDGRLTTQTTAVVIDHALKQEGFARGLGLPGQVPRIQGATSLAPTLRYGGNINGGNADRPLVLGNLVFTGDPARLRRDGWLLGLSGQGNGRLIYGAGRYMDLGFGVQAEVAPHYAARVVTAQGSLCAKHRLSGWWYLDACLGATAQDRALEASASQTAGAQIIRLFATPARQYHQAAIGIDLRREADFDQTRLRLDVQSILGGGAYGRVTAVLGDAVAGQLALRHEMSVMAGMPVQGRSLQVHLQIARSEGGRVLGIARDETAMTLALGYRLRPNITLTLGQQITTSTIAYFSERQPIVGLSITGLRF